MQNNICIKLFILALFKIVKYWKPSKYSSVGGQVMVHQYDEMLHRHKKRIRKHTV